MYTIYTVRYGDTLESIADMYGMTIDDIKALNSANLDNIMMGEEIIIPSNNGEVLKTYVVLNGDTLYNIAKRNNIDINTILLLNGLNKNDFLYPGQEIVLPVSSDNLYLTMNDDTLDGVIAKNNISLEDLLRLNKNIYLLPEQMLILKD